MTIKSPHNETRLIQLADLTDAFDFFAPVVQEKTIIITGGTRGIGRALCLYFAKLGAHVVTDGRDAELLEQITKASGELAGSIQTIIGDINDSVHRTEIFNAAMKIDGRIDVLINNAGSTDPAPLADMSLSQWRSVLSTSLDSVFEMSQLAGRAMLSAGYGKIVNFSSILGTTALAEHGNYCTSKGGIEQLTRSLAVEWGSSGVNVNAIAPGYVKTRMNDIYRKDDDTRRSMLASIPAGRFGELEDMIGPVLFLVSALSDYCHGTILQVDGAYLCR